MTYLQASNPNSDSVSGGARNQWDCVLGVMTVTDQGHTSRDKVTNYIIVTFEKKTQETCRTVTFGLLGKSTKLNESNLIDFKLIYLLESRLFFAVLKVESCQSVQ